MDKLKSKSIENNVVKIYTEYIEKSYIQPWTNRGKHFSNGTGFCYELDFEGSKKKYIITNAHCVQDSISIRIIKNGSYTSKVLKVIYECDLAVLSLDEELAKQMESIKLGEFPEKLEEVYVYGYPLGGENISVTTGVVNRVHIIEYYDIIRGICIQIDAPINFGNSGGPVVNSKGLLVGIAFSGEDDSSTQNMGYIIPTVIFNYFIKAIKTEFNGLSTIKIHTQNMDSQIKSYLKINESGVVIVNSDEPKLQKWDVITAINNNPVDSDGNVKLNSIIKHPEMNEIIHANSIISLTMPGDIVKLTIIRSGEKMEIDIIVNSHNKLCPLMDYQLKPSYFIIYGMVFLPLSYMLYKEKKQNSESVSHLYNYLDSDNVYSDNQIIILSESFEVNIPINSVLKTVNNIEINSLKHLVETVEQELESSKYIIFNFRDVFNVIVLESKKVKSEDSIILHNNFGSISNYEL